jgi:alkanesulfonate monooxygenase SsuD/methylene tetrahydromethanopterin reductase-like flavin-dependent oxidoreductase (luciferase family)
MGFEIGIDTFGELTSDRQTGKTPSAAERMRETIEQGVLADQVGLDVVGIGEHQRSDFIASTPAVILAAIASQTEHVRLISTVTVLISADPVRTFQDFATLDLISGGRAEIIAGRGSYTDSFPLFGFDLNDYAELYREKLNLLLTIRENNPVTWSGRFRPPLVNADVAPRPIQAKLPIWVGVGGTPSSAEYAGHMGLPMANGVPLGTVEAGLHLRQAYEAAAIENGHDLTEMPTTLHGHGFVARTGQEARDIMYPTSTRGYPRTHASAAAASSFPATRSTPSRRRTARCSSAARRRSSTRSSCSMSCTATRGCSSKWASEGCPRSITCEQSNSSAPK